MTERRQAVLTEADLEKLAEMMKQHNVCRVGISQEVATALSKLTVDDLTFIRLFVRVTSKACNITGAIVLAGIIGGIVAIFTRGWWATLLTGGHK